MRILVGIPTHREPSTITDAVRSALNQRRADVQVLVSDRSPNEESLLALEDVGMDDRVELRASLAPNALANFVETGRAMLARDETYDAYALLAGDDLWSDNVAAECMGELRVRNVDIVTPVFRWVGDVELPLPTPLRFLQAKPWRRQLSAALRMIRLQPANLIYGIYSKAGFEELIDRLDQGGRETPYAFDVGVAMELIAKFSVAHSELSSNYRRVDVHLDLALDRLAMTPPPRNSSYLRMLLYGRIIVLKDAWLISAVLPRLWRVLPLRVLLSATWTIEDTVIFFVRAVRRPS